MTPLIQNNDREDLVDSNNSQNEDSAQKLCSVILKVLESAWTGSQDMAGEQVHPRLQYGVVYAIGQLALAFEVSEVCMRNRQYPFESTQLNHVLESIG